MLVMGIVPRTVHSFQKRSPLVRAEPLGCRQAAAAVEAEEAVERASPAVQTRKSRARMVRAAVARVAQVGVGVGELGEVVLMPSIAGAAAAKGRGAAKEGVEKASF